MKNGIILKHDIMKKRKEIYTLQLVDIRQLDSVMKLQDYVYDNLTNKKLFVKDSYEDLYSNLITDGKIIGVFNKENKLIAYRYVSFPGLYKSNLGNDFKMSREDLNRVVHLESTVVDPEYRGNNLQSITLKQAIEIINPLDYQHLICTVSPKNFYSLYNIMKNGLSIKALKKKYGEKEDQSDGVWRFILHRNLNKVRNSDPIDFTKCKIESFDEQKDLIDRGYVGYKLNKDERIIHYTQFTG